MGRKKKVIPRVLPSQFWAVVWNDTIVGPFTDVGAARSWAVEHNSIRILNIYAPLLDEPNKGHAIGRFLLPEEI